MASRGEWWWVENGEWHRVLNGGGVISSLEGEECNRVEQRWEYGRFCDRGMASCVAWWWESPVGFNTDEMLWEWGGRVCACLNNLFLH